MLKVHCTTSELESDDFVGLKFENNRPRIVFPRGYAVSDGENAVRTDIIRLLATINKFRDRYEGDEERAALGEQYFSFPLLSYQYIIQDYLLHGYYVEKESRYVDSLKGKINWKRTIQHKQPQIDGRSAVYLNFVVRKNIINDSNLLTKIHEYCVYESFHYLGWLYTGGMPKKPTISLNKKAFTSILSDALKNTNDTEKRRLFSSMLNVILEATEQFNTTDQKAFGVDRFEYVWEGLIDYVFGEDNKEDFFPHSTWDIIGKNGIKKVNAPLEPDTIMMYHNAIYVVDAKYYRYGVTLNPEHLPGTSSIQKQITYGEYIEKKLSTDRIFNAFVMPFNKKESEDNYRFVSVGTADWKDTADKRYEFVLGILMDTRHLINTYARKNKSDIEELSTLIERSLESFLRAN